MNRLEWRDEYLIHELEVDNEHKHLFAIAQQAFQIVEPSKKREKVKQIIHELSHYTHEHFEHEELFMQRIGYPMLDEHKIQHQQIIAEMTLFIHKIPTMKLSQIEKELALFIDQWIVHHIADADIKIHLWHDQHKGLETKVIGQGVVDEIIALD